MDYLREEELMDYLPKDPAILVLSVRSSSARLLPKRRKNMLLRDEEFDTLESLCYRSNLFACLSKNFGTEPKDIKNYLHGHGFVFSDKQKQLRPIGYDKKETNEQREQSCLHELPSRE